MHCCKPPENMRTLHLHLLLRCVWGGSRKANAGWAATPELAFSHNCGKYLWNISGNYTRRMMNALWGNVLNSHVAKKTCCLYSPTSCFYYTSMPCCLQGCFSSNVHSTTPGTWGRFPKQAIRSRVCLGPDRDRFFSRVSVGLFWSTPKCDYCVHTQKWTKHLLRTPKSAWNAAPIPEKLRHWIKYKQKQNTVGKSFLTSVQSNAIPTRDIYS